MRCLLEPSAGGVEVWATSTLTDTDGPSWWEGWWSPKPAVRWFDTLPHEWHFLGYSLRTATIITRSFLSYPHPEMDEFTPGLPPTGYAFSEEGTDRLELHHNAVLKEPTDPNVKGGQPKFTGINQLKGRICGKGGPQLKGGEGKGGKGGPQPKGAGKGGKGGPQPKGGEGKGGKGSIPPKAMPSSASKASHGKGKQPGQGPSAPKAGHGKGKQPRPGPSSAPKAGPSHDAGAAAATLTASRSRSPCRLPPIGARLPIKARLPISARVPVLENLPNPPDEERAEELQVDSSSEEPPTEVIRTRLLRANLPNTEREAPAPTSSASDSSADGPPTVIVSCDGHMGANSDSSESELTPPSRIGRA